MAKQQNQELAKRYTPEEISGFMNDILNGKTSPITFQECFDLLESMPDNQLTELSGGDMIEWKEGETTSWSFEGFQQTTIKNKPVTLANLRDRSGKLMVTGAAMAVNSLKNVQSLPAFVKITCEGKEAGANGDYYILRVKTF